MPDPEPQAKPDQPPGQPDQHLTEEPPPPVATDLRTGTEVHPKVVAHHAAFLQGEPYDSPYPEPPPATKEEAPAQ
jgi:hypothetical protein